MNVDRGGVLTLNEYGDADFSPTAAFGVDVSSQRLDAIDLRALAYVVARHETQPAGLDLGCGLGTPSIAFALAGATMLLVDSYDFHSRFQTIAELLPVPRLHFLQRDLTELTADDVPDRLAFAYSQRTLHYLRFDDAALVLRLLKNHLEPNAPIFLSLSGLESELGTNYPAREVAIRKRFSRIAPQLATKHHINRPVCLYTADDIRTLARESGLTVGDVWTSEFGNVKAELVNR
jgi:SAM-dependent methyltransferase